MNRWCAYGRGTAMPTRCRAAFKGDPPEGWSPTAPDKEFWLCPKHSRLFFGPPRKATPSTLTTTTPV